MTEEKSELITEVDELRAARRQLETDLAALAESNQALEAQNTEKQETISGLSDKQRLLSNQLSLITEQFEQLELISDAEVTELTSRNLGLSEQLDSVTIKLAQLNLELQKQKLKESDLIEELAKKRLEFEQLQSNEQLVAAKFTAAQNEIDLLSDRIRKRELENQTLQQEADRQGSRFISLQDEYVSLEEKYRSLVRAARSTAGKQVALVYFIRNQSGYEYRLQQPNETEPDIVTKSELDQKLTALKERHGLDLYTRVIIPENSNLSHDEAWRFTQEVLNRYDYYYQPQQ